MIIYIILSIQKESCAKLSPLQSKKQLNQTQHTLMRMPYQPLQNYIKGKIESPEVISNHDIEEAKFTIDGIVNELSEENN